MAKIEVLKRSAVSSTEEAIAKCKAAFDEDKTVTFFTADSVRVLSGNKGRIEFQGGKFEARNITQAKQVISNSYFGREIFLAE